MICRRFFSLLSNKASKQTLASFLLGHRSPALRDTLLSFSTDRENNLRDARFLEFSDPKSEPAISLLTISINRRSRSINSPRVLRDIGIFLGLMRFWVLLNRLWRLFA